MSGSTRIDVPAPEAAPLLPKELLFVYPFAPLIAVLLLVEDLFTLSTTAQLQKLASMTIPFVAMTLTLHPLYVFVMPRLLARLESRWARGALHVVVVAGGATLLSLAIRPLHNFVCGKELGALPFAVVSVIISSLIIFPSLLVQGQQPCPAHRAPRHGRTSGVAAGPARGAPGAHEPALLLQLHQHRRQPHSR